MNVKLLDIMFEFPKDKRLSIRIEYVLAFNHFQLQCIAWISFIFTLCPFFGCDSKGKTNQKKGRTCIIPSISQSFWSSERHGKICEIRSHFKGFSFIILPFIFCLVTPGITFGFSFPIQHSIFVMHFLSLLK